MHLFVPKGGYCLYIVYTEVLQFANKILSLKWILLLEFNKTNVGNGCFINKIVIF